MQFYPVPNWYDLYSFISHNNTSQMILVYFYTIDAITSNYINPILYEPTYYFGLIPASIHEIAILGSIAKYNL